MLRIAVYDNTEDVANAMRVQVRERLPSCEIQVFTSWDTLLEERATFDLVFLDINSLLKHAPEMGNSRQLFIKTRYKNSTIDMADIYYLENAGRKIVAHTKLETIEFYAVMTELEKKLGNVFFRCHRGYLVNLEYVVKYDTSNIWLSNGEVIYLAKGRYQEFERRYKLYIREREAFDQ